MKVYLNNIIITKTWTGRKLQFFCVALLWVTNDGCQNVYSSYMMKRILSV